jgi:hypothetical protein
MAVSKLSAITPGTFAPATDSLVGVRSGTTDLLLGGFGTAALVNTGTSGATIPLLNASNTFSAGTAQTFGSTTTSGTGTTTIATTMSGGSQTSNFINITATLPTTLTAQTTGINILLTSAGSSVQQINGFSVQLLAGYTGATTVVACQVLSFVAGTGVAPYSGSSLGNFGIFGGSLGATVGTNVGFYGLGANGGVNYGVFGEATTTKNGATNVGVVGTAINAGTTPIQVGGYFGLLGGANPTFTSCAICANNGSVAAPVALFQVGGVTKSSVDANGNLTTQAAGIGLQIKSGSNARIGTGTLSGGTLTVANTSVTANTRVFLTDTTSGALTNVGSLTVVTTAGTGFVVTSSNVLDTSTFNWLLVESL